MLCQGRDLSVGSMGFPPDILTILPINWKSYLSTKQPTNAPDIQEFYLVRLISSFEPLEFTCIRDLSRSSQLISTEHSLLRMSTQLPYRCGASQKSST